MENCVGGEKITEATGLFQPIRAVRGIDLRYVPLRKACTLPSRWDAPNILDWMRRVLWLSL